MFLEESVNKLLQAYTSTYSTLEDIPIDKKISITHNNITIYITKFNDELYIEQYTGKNNDLYEPLIKLYITDEGLQPYHIKTTTREITHNSTELEKYTTKWMNNKLNYFIY